jgi:rubrerythrin
MVYLARQDRKEIKITCPQCKYSSKYSVSYVEDVLHDGLQIVCLICNEPFTIVTVISQRAAEQRNAPVHAEQKAAVVCPICNTHNIVNRCATCGHQFVPLSKRSAGG